MKQPDGSRRESPLKRIYRDRVGYAFALPFMILFITFTVLPVLISIFFSFTRFNVLQPPKFIFLDNYVQMFLKDDIFAKALKNTLILAAITGPVGYLMCFFFAWGLNELPPKLRAVLTLMFYAPSISGNTYLVWTVVFNGDSYGLLNGLLLNLGVINEPIRYLQNPSYMMPIAIGIILWMSLGTSFLVFIAGFQGIDHSLYEAGAMDGIKNRWQELWYITLPSMRPQLMFGAIMSITSAFNVGDVITGVMGFPSYDYVTHTLMHHLQDYGGARFEMGYASAIAVVLFALMVGCNLIIQRFLSKIGQ